MSSKFILTDSKEHFLHVYEGEWKIGHSYQGKEVETNRSSSFSPIPGVSVQFCWESSVYEFRSHKFCVLHFKLTLMKLTGFNIPLSLSMKLNLKVSGLKGDLGSYISESPIFIHDMNSLTCVKINYECFQHNSGGHTCKFPIDELSTKAVFSFLGLSSPSEYFQKLHSLENLRRFLKDNDAIYNSNSSSDMTVLVGDQKIYVHKCMLMSHSPVLRKMLEHDFVESKTNTLTIVDADYHAFNCFLKFLYSGEVKDQSWSTVKQLYFLADKYDVETLKMECVRMLVSQLTVDNLCETLKIAYDYDKGDDSNYLKEKTQQFAAANFQELMSKSEWKEMALSQPQIGYDVIALIYPTKVPLDQDAPEIGNGSE